MEGSRRETHPGVWLLEGFRRAIVRFHDAASPGAHALETFVPLFEALNWAATLADRIEKKSWSPTLKGIVFARNMVHHQWADALRFKPGGEVGILIIGVTPLGTVSQWLWRDVDEFPRPRAGQHPPGRDEYVAHLEGQDVSDTFTQMLGELAAL